MSLDSLNSKIAGMAVIEKINQVDGFDPAPFAVDYTDLNTGEVRKRLPVMIQMAWFRLKYPEGKIAVTVDFKNNCFIATARVYSSFKEPAENYLSEATASRGYLEDKPSVSPREWAQTAAIGIALRNAGFGLQFGMAGEESEGMILNNPERKAPVNSPESSSKSKIPDEYVAVEPIKTELTAEQKLEYAMKKPCPITKYAGKTLGDMVTQDPRSLIWLATKYKGSEDISEAAKLICDCALERTAV